MPTQNSFNLNGDLLTGDESLQLGQSRAFRYGDGVFESIRIRNGRACFLDDHLARMANGLETLEIASPPSFFAKIRDAVSEVMKSNQLADGLSQGRIRITVWRDGEGTYRPEGHGGNFLVTAGELEADSFLNPATKTLCLVPDPIQHPSRIRSIKSLNALPFVMAEGVAKRSGVDEALMHNDKGLVECSSSNIFFVVENELVTPSTRAGCLAGIMRGKVIEWARAEGIKCHETLFHPSDIQLATECFTTNSISGIRPVSSIDELQLDAAPGVMTESLMNILRERTA